MEATSCRLRHLLRSLPCLRFSQLQFQSPRLFSSSSADASRRSRRDDHEGGTGSAVYRHALQTQRPSTIRWRKELENSARFIGTVYLPLKTFTTRDGRIGVHTLLKVQSSPDSNKFIMILLVMWQEMAELSLQHLKPNDYIYVSGYLGSYTKACENGNVRMLQRVTVKEINYVADNGNKIKHSGELGETPQENRRNRLHLWQVMFANPYEWEDLRGRKVKPSQPDFKHKGTGEALWLNAFDPPWVNKQLQLQDCRTRDMGLRHHPTYTMTMEDFEMP